MATIRHQVWQKGADNAAFLATVPDGLKGYLGDDESAEPPAPNCPYYVLELAPEVPSFDGDPEVVEGSFRLHGYDYPHAGHTRLRKGLWLWLRGFGEGIDPETGSWFVDDDAGEDVFWLRPVGLGVEAWEGNRLTQTAEVQYRKTKRGVLA